MNEGRKDQETNMNQVNVFSRASLSPQALAKEEGKGNGILARFKQKEGALKGGRGRGLSCLLAVVAKWTVRNKRDFRFPLPPSIRVFAPHQ